MCVFFVSNVNWQADNQCNQKAVHNAEIPFINTQTNDNQQSNLINSGKKAATSLWRASVEKLHSFHHYFHEKKSGRESDGKKRIQRFIKHNQNELQTISKV